MQVRKSGFADTSELTYLEICIRSMQKSGLGHDWDNHCCAQLFSILGKVNLVELVELDIIIDCKKNVYDDYF